MQSVRSFPHMTVRGSMHWWQTALLALLVFSLSLTFYLTMLPMEPFLDESNVFVVGDNVARGLDVYKTSISQHMPGSYYLSAIIGLFHPVNENAYRVGFYIMMSLLWTSVFLHFRKRIPIPALILTPVLYICSITPIELGTTMLSEHWAGIGHVILLMELISYEQDHHLSVSQCIWISLAIFLSFGCVFPSAFSVAVVGIGVLIRQLFIIFHETPRENRYAIRRRILLEDLKLMGIILLPWVILISWYAISGTLQTFFYSVYNLNTEVYIKYNPGLTTTAGGAISSFFPLYFQFLSTSVRDFFASVRAETLLPVLTSICPILVGILLCFSPPVTGITYFLAILTIPTRGFHNFHGLHFVCAGIFSACYLCGMGMEMPFRKPRKVISWIALVCALPLMIIPMIPVMPSVTYLPAYVRNAHLDLQMPEPKDLTDVITDRGDRLHYATDMPSSIDLDRGIDYGAACYTPWTWDAFGEEELRHLEENKTKIVFFDPEFVIWKRRIVDYASGMYEYITEHYYNLAENMWIRNEYMGEAVRRMLKAEYEGYLFFDDPVPLTEDESNGTASPDEAYDVPFTVESRCALDLVYLWPVSEGNAPCGDLIVQICSPAGVVAETTLGGEYLALNEMNTAFFPECILQADETYTIRIFSAQGSSPSLKTARLPDRPDQTVWKTYVSFSEVSDDWYDENFEDYGDEEYGEWSITY